MDHFKSDGNVKLSRVFLKHIGCRSEYHNRYCLQFPQHFYFFSKKLLLLYFLQFFVFYSCISRYIAMSMILASFVCLSTTVMSVLLASTILSHCTLKSHRTLKPVFSTTCSRVCLYHWSARSSSAYPHSCQLHTAPHYHVAFCTHVGLTCSTRRSTHLLGDLHFLCAHPTLRWFWGFCQCKTWYS